MASTTTGGISSPSESLIITSPSLSASSLSSSGFDFVTLQPRSSDQERLDNASSISANTTPVHSTSSAIVQPGEESSFSDDDEIVWGISESEDLEGSTGGLGTVLSDDDDFVVLSRNKPAALTSRARTRTSETVESQTGTIRGVPVLPGALEPYPSVNDPQGLSDIASDTLKPNDEVASELASELAKLNVGADSLAGEANGTRTPVEGELRAAQPDTTGALPKKKKGKKKKERTPEEEALRQQRKNARRERKERERQEKKVAKALEREKKAKLAAVPLLSKSASTATLVPSSNTTANRIAPDTSIAVASTLPSPLEPVKTLTTVPTPPDSPKKKSRKRVRKAKATESASAPHNTAVTEKVTEQTNTKSSPTPYDEAVSYITSASRSHLPPYPPSITHHRARLIKDVTLLPRSIRAAKKFIKLRVFVNIKDYLKKRHEGPDVVKGLLFPSRSALVKNMRKNRNFASLKWIKNHGLQDLLVGVFHR
ncbi:hypothetical protein NP233_g7076 [Leucocoprinus birnbaumii]|uniref:Uncharacterized protein n=1 Tax=Leucocoprinus birnbaumii TaxID=56174 RepID=A0AAD5VVD8_9AGAR|nr:hypothetical protein NP233_g7076 [Leucocoprinus birnbaumii]